MQGPFSTPFTEPAHTRTADLVARLRSLEAMGYVTGVVDDRGKFIFISRDELQAVSSYIRRKGRVRISTLAQERLSTRDFSPLPPSRGGTLPPSALGPHPRHRHRNRYCSRSLRARLRRASRRRAGGRLCPRASTTEEGLGRRGCAQRDAGALDQALAQAAPARETSSPLLGALGTLDRHVLLSVLAEVDSPQSHHLSKVSITP